MSNALVERIGQLSALADGKRVILGVVGPPGSGKSTITALLHAKLGSAAAVVPMDGFHLSNAVLERLNRRNRKGAEDTFDSAGFRALLRRIRDDQTNPVYYSVFHREIEESIAAEGVVDSSIRIVIVEGLYLLLPAWSLRDIFDETWFIELDQDTRRKRLIDRRLGLGYSMEEARQWALGSDEVNAQFVATTKQYASQILQEQPGTGGYVLTPN